MNFHVYVNDILGKKIEFFAKTTGMKRNRIVTEALEEWVASHQQQDWPTEVMEFKGVDGIPDNFSFESHRSNLNPPKGEIF